MQQLARYPLLISADLEAGSGMRFDDTINFPWNMAVAATGNPEYARRQGALTAREAHVSVVMDKQTERHLMWSGGAFGQHGAAINLPCSRLGR